jgi:hypothetical protein
VRGLIPATVALAVLSSRPGPAQSPPPAPTRTHVVLLGTGTPPADPDRSGPATAVVVDDTPYLVDMGAGVVRRAKSAVVDKGIKLREMAGYQGQVVVGRDLDVY